MDFLEFDETKTFFVITDLIISLGGINSTVGAALGLVAVLFVIQFSCLLKGILHRS